MDRSKQISFEIDADLDERLSQIVSQKKGLTKKLVARMGLKEKVAEIEAKILKGEDITVTV